MGHGPCWVEHRRLATVFFTDESRYWLDYTGVRTRVWMRPGKRSHAANIAEYNRYGGGSVIVWGGISWGGRT